MKVQPDTTSYTVKALKTIKVISDRNEDADTVKVIKNYSESDEVYFLIVREPPFHEITSPDDIETVEKYKVASHENRFAVRQDVIDRAKEYNQTLNN